MATKTEEVKPKKRPSITKWKPKEEQVLVEQDGKLFVCYFDRIFGIDKLSQYNRFIIRKESYINQLPIISSYTNYFINIYDEDYELPNAYLKIKFEVDKEKAFDEENMQSFIEFLYNVIFTPTMCEKIRLLVKENYLDDIESTDDESKKYKAEKKHLESLEFTNQQIKCLLQISFAMKMMSPAMFHYIQHSHIKLEKGSDIIFRFYEPLFKIFQYGETYDLYETVDNDDVEDLLLQEDISVEEFEEWKDNNQYTVSGNGYETKYIFKDEETGKEKYWIQTKLNLYNKLFVYVKTKVLESNAANSRIFAQREIFGVDLYSVINLFTKKVIISENLVKYKFNEHFDSKTKKFKENVVGFNKTVIKFQLNYFLKEQYAKNINEVTAAANVDGLSGIDKMLMNRQKLDEGFVIMSDLNINMTLDRIQKDIDIPFEDGEIEFYIQNHKPSHLQRKLVNAYYTKYFGAYYDLNVITRVDYLKLMLLLKKKLLLDLGFDDTDSKVIHPTVLPYIICGNVMDRVNMRLIRNNSFIAKIEQNDLYKELLENKYHLLQYIRSDELLVLISSIINTRFSYVLFENPELLGTEIIYSEDVISDEILFYLNII